VAPSAGGSSEPTSPRLRAPAAARAHAAARVAPAAAGSASPSPSPPLARVESLPALLASAEMARAQSVLDLWHIFKTMAAPGGARPPAAAAD
jgi:hypothetical protein